MSSTAAARAASAVARRRTAAALGSLASSTALVDVLTGRADDDLDAISTVQVGRLVRAVPGVGEATAIRICRAAGIDRLTRAGALTPARRRALADALAELDLTTYRGSGPRRRAA